MITCLLQAKLKIGRRFNMSRISITACLVILGSSILFGQSPTPRRYVSPARTSAIPVPAPEIDAGLRTIYSNLGSKTNLYRPGGWFLGASEFIGLPFTPKSDSHVTQIRAAIQYSSGDNQINLSIYSDADGVPGTLLAGPVTVTDLPSQGSCCALAVANVTPLAVKARTEYWVVANTPSTGTGSDFEGAWNDVSKPVVPIAFNGGGTGWFSDNAYGLVAGEVLGTIP
jgi:hypothetical protein